jgi:hypothetical protein
MEDAVVAWTRCIPAFSRKDRGKPRKPVVRITGVPAEMRTEHHPNTRQKVYRYTSPHSDAKCWQQAFCFGFEEAKDIPGWEVSSCLVAQEIRHLVCNLKVPCRIVFTRACHWSLSSSQMIPIHILQSCSLKSVLVPSSCLCPRGLLFMVYE